MGHKIYINIVLNKITKPGGAIPTRIERGGGWRVSERLKIAFSMPLIKGRDSISDCNARLIFWNVGNVYCLEVLSTYL